MPLLEWIAQKHPVLVHLPIAAALLLPFPLLAAQRPGRGIRPWWIVCRYLAWTGLLGALAAAASGFLWARQLGLLPAGAYLVPKGAEGLAFLLRRHQLLGLAGLALGGLTVWSVHRPRKDHQSLGFLALLMGCAWCLAYVGAGLTGGLMTHPAVPAAAPAEARVESPEPQPDPETDAPYRYLDYQALEPLHAEPVKSPEHGGRWIRAWVTPSGLDAYKAGKPLPPGAYAVMSSLEDRWGRPSLEAGPLWALESLADGKASFTEYWPRVPEAKRSETAGQARIYWRGQDAGLKACATCHGQSLSDPAQRSAWVPQRKRAAEAP